MENIERGDSSLGKEIDTNRVPHRSGFSVCIKN